MAVTAIADNYSEQAFDVPDAVCFALIKNGGEVITKLQADTGAKVDIARGTGKVTVSGSREAVTAAAVVMEDLLAANYSCVVAFDDADIVGAIVGKKGENIRKLQVRHIRTHASTSILKSRSLCLRFIAPQEGLDVHIDIDKKHSQVLVRGRREAADAAAVRVQEFIERHAKENAVLNVDLEAIPSLIGKDGANIRKLQVKLLLLFYGLRAVALFAMLVCMFLLGGVVFQDDTGAQIDINSTTGDVRVKGPEEAVKAAVAAITVLCGLDKAKAQVPYDERAIAGFLGKAGANVTALAGEYKVTLTLNRGKKCVVIRGEAADVEAAKAVVAKRLKELVRVEETINFPVARLPYLMGAKGSRIRQLQVCTRAFATRWLPVRSCFVYFALQHRRASLHHESCTRLLRTRICFTNVCVVDSSLSWCVYMCV